MMVTTWHAWAVGTEFVLAALTFATLLVVRAPYGRHVRPGWGPTMPARLGWVIMEFPAVALFAAIYFSGAHRFDAVPLVLLSLWQLHYVNRTFVFPLRMRGTNRRMPVLIAVLAIGFNTLNAFVNAEWIGHLGSYPVAWLTDPRFLVGGTLFLLGWFGNLRADATLRRLRAPGQSDYVIPQGGLFRWVSAPNYLCEIVEWFGWAIATWSWAGLAFAIYTTANLLPRALSHHAWYRERFADYPEDRKALIPLVL